MEKETKESNATSAYLAFIVSPIIAVFVALKNFRAPSSKNIIWIFTIFFGYTLVISNDEFDLVRYKEEFENFYFFDGSYEKFFAYLFSEDSQNADFFIPFVGFFTYNTISTDFKVYLAIMGLLYGYIYSRNIWYILNRINGNLLTTTIICVTVFAFLFPLWRGINGPRFSIAVHVYFFGVCKYLIDNKKYGLLIASLSLLAHFSVAIAVVALWIYVIFGNKMNVYFIIYSITLFIKEINVTSLNDLAENLPKVFSTRVSDYTREEYVVDLKEASLTVNWYANYYIMMLRWTASGIVMLLYLRAQDYFKINKKQADLFAFCLLFLAFANIMSLVASGDRFLSFAYLFVYAIYAWFTNNYKTEKPIFDAFNRFAKYPLALFFIVEFRIGADFMGLVTVFGNPLVSFFVENDKAIISLIK